MEQLEPVLPMRAHACVQLARERVARLCSSHRLLEGGGSG